MIYSILRWLYNFLFILVLPFIFLKNLWRSRLSSGYRKRNLERLGFCPFKIENPIWIHAVSMGEIISITPLVKKLLEKYPKKTFLITTMSVTGSNQVKSIYQQYPNVYHCYLPYDISLCLKLFLKRTKPKCLIIMETELWPNLLYLCKKNKIPVMLTNARLSEKSLRGYQKALKLVKTMLKQINLIAVQNHSDKERFLKLGVNHKNLHVTGSLKFDIESPNLETDNLLLKLKSSLDLRPVWVAASTHQGEDEIIINAHQKLIEKIPNALLIIIPRHPERFQSTYLTLIKHFKTVRRSKNQTITDDIQAYLGDTMGEVVKLLSLCDVAFIGGSLVNHGGHNMLEPAALKLPVISGPYTFNFSEITTILHDAGALKIIENADSLANELIYLFNNETIRKQMGDDAYQVVKSNQGALEHQFELALQLIETNYND